MASSGTGLHPEVYRDILSAQIQPNAAKLIGWHFIVKIHDDQEFLNKQEKKTGVFEGQKWNILKWASQSPDFNQIEHTFLLLKSKLMTKGPTNNN